jgi:hypothetical protein
VPKVNKDAAAFGMVEPTAIRHHGEIVVHVLGQSYGVSLVPPTGGVSRHLYPLRMLGVHLHSRRKAYLPISGRSYIGTMYASVTQ